MGLNQADKEALAWLLITACATGLVLLALHFGGVAAVLVGLLLVLVIFGPRRI